MIDFASIRQANPIADVVGRYIELRRAGTEYRGLCPFHADKSPSLYVNPKKGKAFCMACHWAGDVLDFVAEYEQCDVAEAARKLGADELPRDRPAPAPLPPDTSDEWKPILPVPDDAPAYDPAQTFNPKRGRAVRYKPARQWAYRDADGRLLGYVLRLEFDGTKITPTITYCQHADGTRRWCAKPFPVMRPLYGIDRLAANPGVPVVVVEGEKAADAAQAALPRMVVVTWPGGTNGVRWSDFGPLELRDVTFWPDADAVGIEAMLAIAARVPLKRERWIRTDGLAKGFDAADVEGSIPAFCKERVTDVRPGGEVPPPPDEGDSEPKGEPEVVETAAGGAHDATMPVVAAPVNTVERVRADLDGTVSPDMNLPAKYSEDNAAIAFAQQAERAFRYVPAWGKWMMWDGTRWLDDETGVYLENVRIMCRAICDAIRMDGVEFTTEAKRNRAIATYGNYRTIKNIEQLARTDRALAARAGQWDSDLWLINTPGGVVDLRTGELRPGRREDYMTRITAATPRGDCPTWREFLNVATDGDEAMQSYLQRLAGYCLTGEVKEQMFAFIYGTGGNGKGTFITTLTKILGDYAQPANMELLTERKGDDHPTALAGLQGARLVSAQETEEGKRWAEARIKSLTGGDLIRARYMRQDEFTYMPQFKLVIAGNHKPGLRNVDDAIKRRLHLIPFTVTIPPDKKDPNLPAKLLAEADGIMAWAVEGCAMWRETGLKPPQRVLAATEEYLEQQDVLGGWIDDCCVTMSTVSCRSGPLYASFKQWAETAGEYVMPQKRWVAALESRGFRSTKSMGVMVYRGIALKGDDM